MWIALQQAGELRLGQAHLGQHGLHALALLRSSQRRLVHAQAFAHDLGHGQARRQRGERILEHHLHLAAQLLVVRTVVLRGLLPGLAGHLQLAAGRQQAQQRLRQCGLARAGFAHHAQGTRLRQAQGHVLHGDEFAFAEPPAHARQRHRVSHAQAARLRGGWLARHLGLLMHIALRGAVDQPAGVVVLRRGEHLAHGALLHQVAVLHDGHTVGEAAHQLQVVGDEQHGHARLALEIGQQLQDLPAQRHVQRRGGLIGQQQARPAGQGHGDHGALALPARQLVGKAGGAARGLGNARGR